MSQLIRKQIGKDIHINFIRDDKFKFARASVLFLVPLKKQTASGSVSYTHLVTVRMKEDLPREEILRRLRALPGVVEATVL